MNSTDPQEPDARVGADSGPTAIGEIMPAVLARYGLARDEPWQDEDRWGDLVPAAEVAPATLMLAGARCDGQCGLTGDVV